MLFLFVDEGRVARLDPECWQEGAREDGIVEVLLAPEEIGGRPPCDAGRLGDLLQARALEPETGEAILRGDKDCLFRAFRVPYAFRVSFRHARSRLNRDDT